MAPDEWLAELFEFEYCAECGGDAKDHDAIPLMGNWFARCKPVERDPVEVYGTPEHEAWLMQMEARGDYQ